MWLIDWFKRPRRSYCLKGLKEAAASITRSGLDSPSKSGHWNIISQFYLIGGQPLQNSEPAAAENLSFSLQRPLPPAPWRCTRWTVTRRCSACAAPRRADIPPAEAAVDPSIPPQNSSPPFTAAAVEAEAVGAAVVRAESRTVRRHMWAEFRRILEIQPRKIPIAENNTIIWKYSFIQEKEILV